MGLGALMGLALGIVASVATDVPLAPEAGLVLGRSSAGSRVAIAPRSAPSSGLAYRV